MHGWGHVHLAICAGLIALCFALSAIVYAELLDEAPAIVGAKDKSQPPAAAASSATERPFALPSLESYAEVTARPLFSPSRRPAPPQVAQGRSLDAGSLVLSGIILTSEARLALVQPGKGAKTMRLSEGQEVQGWIVQSILPDRIVLRRGASEHEIKLRDDAQRAAAAPSGAPGASAPTN
jgi:general secretion pathway protein N